MTNPVFPPTLGAKQDSKYYGVDVEDVALKSKMDGGYVVSRARTTRTPRLTYSSGLTDISSDEAAQLRDFYKSVGGGSVVFDWTDPASNTVIAVRFVDQLSFKYTGIGFTQRFDVQFKVEEA